MLASFSVYREKSSVTKGPDGQPFRVFNTVPLINPDISPFLITTVDTTPERPLLDDSGVDLTFPGGGVQQ
jgi:hypothetical protein